MASSRREITLTELLLVALGAIVLSVVMNWPLVLNLGEDIPKDIGDPLVQSWQVAWGGHALAHQPLEFFQSNEFWPLDDTLAFSDALLGYAPAGLFGEGAEAAVVRYDLLFLFAYALPFFGTYLLARELGVGPVPALVAGAAFAYAPFRLEQDGHMHVISSGGIALAFALGVRGYRLRRPWTVVTGFAVATWQLSLGFTLGLPLAYLLALTLVIAAVVWLRRGRPALDRRLVAATVAGAILFLGFTAIISRPYFRVANDYPEATRSTEEVEGFSGGPWLYLVAPAENPVWGGATAPIRDTLSGVAEKTLFPGLVILGLAIAGMWSTAYPRRLRIGLAIGIGVVCALALGFKEAWGPVFPYRIVYELLPGWEGIRTPGRLFTFASLGLALLAAAGTALVMRRVAERRISPRAPLAVACVLAAMVVIEGRGLPFDPFDDLAQPSPPDPPTDVSAIAAPQLHLPAMRPEDNRRYLLWSSDGFPEMVNGRSSTNPRFTASVIARADRFPRGGSVPYLRRLGVRSVVVHPRLTTSRALSRAARRPVRAPGIEGHRSGEVIVYEILPRSAGSGPDGSGPARSPRRSR